MAKRFIDTGIFDDEWFMDLSKDAKLLWLYLITKCDHAGIIKLNEKLCKAQTEIKSIVTVIEELGDRIITVDEHLYFIPKFLEFQYPDFPKSSVRQQNSAISILERYGLWDGEKLKTQVRVSKELPNSYEHVNGNEYTIFYNSELEKSENDPAYKKLIETIYKENSLNRPLKVILSFKDQISFEQFKKLYDLKNQYKFSISEYLEKIENWGNKPKRTSVYLTMLTFLRKDFKDLKV